MFTQQPAPRESRESLEILLNALDDVNERIQLQEEMIKHGGGMLPVDQCEEILVNFQKEKAEIEKKIAAFPDCCKDEASHPLKLSK